MGFEPGTSGSKKMLAFSQSPNQLGHENLVINVKPNLIYKVFSGLGGI